MLLEFVRWIYHLKTVWAVVLSLLIGAALIVLTGHSPVQAYQELFGGAFFDYWGLSATLIKICPLVLAGLAVTFPLRVGLFNVGAEGQIYMGGLFATLLALYFSDLPSLIAILAATLAGMIGGAFWALIPAMLKAYRNLNEVIVTLLMNYIAINIVSYAVGGPLRAPNAPYPYSSELPESYWLPYLMPDTDAHVGVILAVIAALLVYVILRFTSVGFGMNTVSGWVNLCFS